MPGLRENLQFLRAQKGMSQSQLAARLDVSRQSVAKWEAEKSYPEMEKLIKICDIFGCSIDDLVRGDLASLEAAIANDGGAGHAEGLPKSPSFEPAFQQPEVLTSTNGCSWTDFDTFTGERARMLSLAAFFLVGGFSADFLAQALQIDQIGSANQLGPMLLLICIVISTALGLAAHRARASFAAKNETVGEPEPEDEPICESRKRSVFLSFALAIVVALVPSFFPALDGKSAYASATWWLSVAVAVGLIVNSWVRASAFDIGRYNRAARRFASKR